MNIYRFVICLLISVCFSCSKSCGKRWFITVYYYLFQLFQISWEKVVYYSLLLFVSVVPNLVGEGCLISIHSRVPWVSSQPVACTRRDDAVLAICNIMLLNELHYQATVPAVVLTKLLWHGAGAG